MYPEFYEHPPLAFGLQSIWFMLFGDSIYVERFYSLFSFLLVGFFIVLIWKQFTKSYKNSWLPLFLWITVSTVSWACANNLLENTMTIFVGLSVWLYLKSNERSRYLPVVLSGLALSLAFLSKGFTGLYIWGLPLFSWLIIRHESFAKMSLKTGVLVAATVLPILSLLLFSEDASSHLRRYMAHQVIGSIQNVTTVDSRWAILGEFLQASIVPLLVTLVLLAQGLKKRRAQVSEATRFNSTHALLLFLLVLSGILPIMISMKQRGFYILTVYPFMAISLGMLVRFKAEHIVSRFTEKQTRLLRVIALILLVSSIAVSVAQVGRVGRDMEKIADCHAVIDTVGEHASIGLSTNLFTDWSLHGYMARYGHVSLMVNDSAYNFYLSDKANEHLANYERVDVKLSRFFLYKKR